MKCSGRKSGKILRSRKQNLQQANTSIHAQKELALSTFAVAP
jgi:hypothetical protein